MSNSRMPAVRSGRERSALSRGTPQRTSVSAVSGMSRLRQRGLFVGLPEALLLLLLVERLGQSGHVLVAGPGAVVAVRRRRLDAEVGELVGIWRRDRLGPCVLLDLA